ncbi:hypothetical protein BGW80DRAFT_600675 [Lactifluus volemus]|nr:hypothetical protein BGW80DRAFT_600675 [Lactifluus volemus]
MLFSRRMSLRIRILFRHLFPVVLSAKCDTAGQTSVQPLSPQETPYGLCITSLEIAKFISLAAPEQGPLFQNSLRTVPALLNAQRNVWPDDAGFCAHTSASICGHGGVRRPVDMRERCSKLVHAPADLP